MEDSDPADRAEDRQSTGRRVGFSSEEPDLETPTVTWRTVRFMELFFAVSCMSSLMALYIMNPIYDDYTRFCEDLVKSLRSPETKENNHPSLESKHFDYVDYEDETFERKPEETLGELTTKSDSPDLRRFFFRLSHAIILFTLTTTVLTVLVLDLMIFMLAISEILCLIIMVLSLDMYLGAINSTILAVSALALGLSICFVTDIVYTSVRGNG